MSAVSHAEVTSYEGRSAKITAEDIRQAIGAKRFVLFSEHCNKLIKIKKQSALCNPQFKNVPQEEGLSIIKDTLERYELKNKIRANLETYPKVAGIGTGVAAGAACILFGPAAGTFALISAAISITFTGQAAGKILGEIATNYTSNKSLLQQKEEIEIRLAEANLKYFATKNIE